MQILKLFFDHDLRLDDLAKRNANKTREEVEATLEDFMKPTPTYSKFYVSATDLEKERFGINVLEQYGRLAGYLGQRLKAAEYRTSRTTAPTLPEILEAADIGEAVLITRAPDQARDIKLEGINLEDDSNVGHHKEELREILLAGHRVLYKERAHDGFDLHLFSRENIYSELFPAFKKVLDEDTRFFSINSKRMRSEKHFYFETWTLDRPPHGAEEVFPETEL